MKNQNAVHIRLSSNEATNLKRDMLSGQMSSIRISRTIQNFNELRQRELEIKRNLQKGMRELRLDMKKVEELLPKVNLPKILQKEDEEEGVERKIIKEISMDTSLEEQLQEIQNRLNSLE